jgi:aminodeoxyfutalosine synthase
MNAVLRTALEKGGDGQRLTPDEAYALGRINDPEGLHLLGEAALKNRQQRFGRRATYVFSANINPSNLCEGSCRFCRFAARPGDAHAYVLDEATIVDRVAQTEPTEVHLVGGMNDQWPFERNLTLVQSLRTRWPALHIKGFTAVEMDYFARTTGREVGQILQAFRDAGLDAMPGGGAELFAARMRKAYCPHKISANQWLEIHQMAHRLGLSTNATMLYGLDETAEERVDHLLALRAAQDSSQGFSCFIPLAYQQEAGEQETAHHEASPRTHLAIIATARLVLDNFPHIKAYWPMIGLETAAAGLSWGADDLDGTLSDEKIAHAAGAATPRSLSRARLCQTIRLGGFQPLERDGRFQPTTSAEKEDQPSCPTA